jgi:3-dehydroquinate dehydratase-2
MRLLLINGPNLNLLGHREPDIYGKVTYDDLILDLKFHAEKSGATLDCFQSNHEGELIDCLHNANATFDAVILNPGALTHYSYAIRDAIQSIGIPVLEVHISNIYTRESFRQISVTAPACIGQITGLGIQGYYLAIDYLINSC